MSKKGQSAYSELNNREFLWRKYKTEGLEVREIAEELECHKGAIWQALKKFGISTHCYHQELTNYTFLWKKYWEEELTLSQIATMVGCNHETLLRAFEKLNIPTRTMSECQKGKKNGMYGKHHSEETLQKIRDKLGTGKDNHSYGIPFTEEHKRKIGIASHNCTEEKRRKLSESGKGKRNAMYGKHPSEETRCKLRDIGKKHWQDPVYVEKMLIARNAKPNKVEIVMNTLLQKLIPDTFRFNGDFRCGISIGGKIPDFINIEGEKIVIEVFGPWHDESFMRQNFKSDVTWKRTEFGTKAVYSQLGYKCIIFWENDLKQENVEEFVLKKLEKSNVL